MRANDEDAAAGRTVRRGGAVTAELPVREPPCRSVLTVVPTTEARLYRYLTCGGPLSHFHSHTTQQEVSPQF